MLRPLLFIALTITATAVPAQPNNPLIDYPGFEKLTSSVGPYRQSRLLSWHKFEAAARRRGALILDARSADAYAAGHIKGAVNLPFTDFTAKSLAETIGDKDRPILIYCNNNFSNNEPPVVTKQVQLALNIQTFINLVGYGYRNVWELNEVVDFRDPRIGWVSGAPTLAKAGR
jgi:hypothetical protein